MGTRLLAGAAVADITPRSSSFLYGYPHVRRYSTGVHDPLLSAALYLSDGATQAMFLSNDLIWVSKETTRRIRERIRSQVPVPAGHIMITASHTHSGPMTLDLLSNEADPVVPKTDPEYVDFLEEAIARAAVTAFRNSGPAEAGLAVSHAEGIGTHRRDPQSPADPQVPVFLVRRALDARPIACMLVYSMHPTVLHEDSLLISADFPGMARQFLQEKVLGRDCPVLYHTGPAGNQSPRHRVRANSFPEARRLGCLLGKSVAEAMERIVFRPDHTIACSRVLTDLPRRRIPSCSEAQQRMRAARERLELLRETGAAREQIRTAEVDWFGSEESWTLAKASGEARLESFYRSVLPAEIQSIQVGPWSFVGWPGEVFVEYSLSVKKQFPDVFIISLANGELQGYIVTPEAEGQGAYEAGNSLFAPESGAILVEKSKELLSRRSPT